MANKLRLKNPVTPIGGGLRAAIYARKSTDDSGKGEDLRSCDMQIANAQKYAEKQGWQVLEDHVYKDDGVSGALVSRPDFDRLKAALGLEEGKPLRHAPDLAALPFDVLICRDQSRLIRNADHATRQIKRFLRAGIKICHYKTGEILDVANFKSLMVGVQGHVDSEYREAARQNVREGLARYAEKGYVCGGVCYGYTNKPVMGESASGQPTRLYTDFTINAEQAKVVLRIFRMFAAGFGPRVIAKAANGDPRYRAESQKFFKGKRPPKPAQGKRGSGSWSPSAIRDMLRNERYAGVLVFGRTQKQE